MYLLGGRCVQEGECPATWVAYGDAAYGRTCLAVGALCDFTGAADPASTGTVCRSPRELGDCLKSRVQADGTGICEECDETTSWLIDGRCRSKRICDKGKYRDNGERCNCNYRRPDESDGDPSTFMIDDNCFKCNHWKEPRPQAPWQWEGTYRECIACRHSTLFVAKDAECIPPDQCPDEEARYDPASYRGACEPPFECNAGMRSYADPSATRQADDCFCRQKGKCQSCTYGAGADGFACKRCKRYSYLLDGTCISQEECVGTYGGRPIGEYWAGRECVVGV